MPSTAALNISFNLAVSGSSGADNRCERLGFLPSMAALDASITCANSRSYSVCAADCGASAWIDVDDGTSGTASPAEVCADDDLGAVTVGVAAVGAVTVETDASVLISASVIVMGIKKSQVHYKQSNLIRQHQRKAGAQTSTRSGIVVIHKISYTISNHSLG